MRRKEGAHVDLQQIQIFKLKEGTGKSYRQLRNTLYF